MVSYISSTSESFIYLFFLGISPSPGVHRILPGFVEMDHLEEALWA